MMAPKKSANKDGLLALSLLAGAIQEGLRGPARKFTVASTHWLSHAEEAKGGEA